MKANKWKLVFLYLILFLSGLQVLQAQTCSISVNSSKICLGNPASFRANFSGWPQSLKWDFGDGNSDTVFNPAYKYKDTGTYVVKLLLKYPGGRLCSADAITVRVFSLPVARLLIGAENGHCFYGNNVCFTDSSIGVSAPIIKRTILFGDGAGNLSAPLTQKQICHTYTTWGVFSPVIEVRDTNGCLSRIEYKDTVHIKPDVKASISASLKTTCQSSTFMFTNKMISPASGIKQFKWDFGDGSFDHSNLFSASHEYQSSDTFKVTLILEEFSGCIDSFSINVFNPPFSAVSFVVGPDSICYSNTDQLLLMASLMTDVSYEWKFESIVLPDDAPVAAVDRMLIPKCGQYNYSLRVTRSGCDTTVSKVLNVLGPSSSFLFEEDLINRFQCSNLDTVFAPTSLKASMCGNNTIKYLWDFGDTYASQCTTWTDAGLNIGQNCRYSYDRYAWHKYVSLEDNCYPVFLHMKDTVLGCKDIATSTVALGKPSAKNTYTMGPYCQFTKDISTVQPVLFNIPSCHKEKVFILPDSACSTRWYDISGLTPYAACPYVYSDTLCPGNRTISYTIVVKNGTCYDTAFYRDGFFLNDYRVRAKPRLTNLCDSGRVEITLDSLADKRSRSVTTYTLGLPGDKTWVSMKEVVKAQNRTFQQFESPYTLFPSQILMLKKPGKHYVTTFTKSDSGCVNYYFDSLGYGYLTRFERADTNACVGGATTFAANAKYYSLYGGFNSRDYWKEPLPRPEKVAWNFGETSGFNKAGSPVTHVYNSPGIYKIRAVFTDSSGCLDTLKSVIRVSDVRADFKTDDTLLICGQIVQFRDLSQVGLPASDTIVSWLWDFGDGKPASILQHPFHDYTQFGEHTVKLTVKNAMGCMDEISKKIRIKGPEPRFKIIGDTFGCVPFTASFRDSSVNVKYWIWNFGDGTSLSTSTSGSIQHVYRNPGVYEITLYGVDSFMNPVTQSQHYCGAIYPALLQRKIKVTVLSVPPVNFSVPSPVCAGAIVTFTDQSSPLYRSYEWHISNGDIIKAPSSQNSAFYIFDKVGDYAIMYKPKRPNGSPNCRDSLMKTIRVAGVKADFIPEEAPGSPGEYVFTNTSLNGYSYSWDFGHSASGSLNFSNSLNGYHNYNPDTGYFNVCLETRNAIGCKDKICKEIDNIYKADLLIPNVFTPGNPDRINDAFDIKIDEEQVYYLQIYNRWGQLVFESRTDGDQNDGVNWNGRVMNSGEECPSGTYYFIFEYSFDLRQKNKVVTGPLTLIRDERK